MSRCFPFPPPGYEKKATTDGVDLLKKEKDREKKHKKEKKDRDKRDSKEKKGKDRSDGKHREKKEKKERKQEKKDRDKDKDISSASDEKRLPPHFGQKNGDKTSDERKPSGKSEGIVREALPQKGKERDMVTKSISADKKLALQFSGSNGEKLNHYSHIPGHPKDSKFMQELGKRVGDEEKGARNQLVGQLAGIVAKQDEGRVKLAPKPTPTLADSKAKINKDGERRLGGQGIGNDVRSAGNVMAESLSGTDSKMDEGMIGVVTKPTGTWVESKEKNSRRLSGQGIGDGMRLAGNVIRESLSETSRIGIDGMLKPPVNDLEKRMEMKDKTKQKEGDDKRKHKDKRKKSKRKDKDRDKEKKSKEKNELKKAVPDKLPESNKNDLLTTSNVKSFRTPNEGSKIAVVEGNLKKRKDPYSNGVLSVNDTKPSKLPRPPPQPVKENGRILEACQTSLVPGVHGTVDKFMNKEHRINGLIEAQTTFSSAIHPLSVTSPEPLPASLLKPLPASLPKPLPATLQVDHKTKEYRKPPHPDSKFLSEILTVPKMEEWSALDDQEWLFQSSDSQPKKPKVEPHGHYETPDVWSEALHIESADIYALPYVLPF